MLWVVFILYLWLSFPLQLVLCTCTFDTCTNKDQSINQSNTCIRPSKAVQLYFRHGSSIGSISTSSSIPPFTCSTCGRTCTSHTGMFAHQRVCHPWDSSKATTQSMGVCVCVSMCVCVCLVPETTIRCQHMITSRQQIQQLQLFLMWQLMKTLLT